ncbi:DUF1349 domain-containing protein [Microbacterium sp. Mu-80]|uniref:DUF1349 domain-containing protein n=1 Tax=Microbacterium bandirmense TaxID=3122050 RepID=A0ABU8LDN7_9MICO
MKITLRRSRRAAQAVVAVGVAAVMAAAGTLPASAVPPGAGGMVTTEVAPPPADWPVFGYQGIITNKSEMTYNPTNEFIFPSVFHAGEHFANPLGEWYLYTAPHDDPGGIVLMYADSLEGPWTEHTGNPVISRVWEPHYNLEGGRSGDSHVSTPDTFWNAEEGKMFLYFHGTNSTTRYATSDDGITFEYGGVAVNNAMSDVEGGPKTVQSAYARVFEHPDPDSPYNYAMLYMTNDNTPVAGGLPGVRRIRLAESVDARDWVVDPQVILSPGEEEGANVSSPNLWEHDGQLYLLYHASSGNSYARTIDKTLRVVGDTPILLHSASGLGTDTGRVAAPEVVSDGDDTYLFYEAGDRLGGTIAWAKDGAETVIEPTFGGFPTDEANPVFETCAAPGSDEFDEGLDDVWGRTVREDLARHAVSDGTLTIPTYSGGVAAAPLLQQELPDGAWQVTTKITIDPGQTYQQAGLLLYASDTDYLKLDMGQAKPGRVVELVSAGTPSFTTQQRYHDSQIWLRLTSDGSQIEGSVSSDGVNFDRIGSMLSAESAAGVPRFTHVGPFAFRGGAATPEIEATFDWFRFSPSAQQYEECMGVPGEPGEPAELVVTFAHSELAPGDDQIVTGTGFAAGERVVGVMNSDPLDLGVQTAGSDGVVVFSWTIPQDIDDGIHTVTLTGDESGEASAQFRVASDADGEVPGGDGSDGDGSDGDGSDGDGSDGAGGDPDRPGDQTGPVEAADTADGETDLAVTGADTSTAWAAGLLLLLAGAAAVAIGRRRRRTA